ncbi:hypothetical protein [Paenibacillus sp. Soil750]|uniref:hypothetical protein n=1 Tax=Paenibacillus sp. Soil750 TaxID=1736398 RepID=UPI000701E8BA|nr:hypothetical protein [Paenibacillus sp. Soil750]KRE70756.1 hypothetical protein ASL11_10695 [Paenibacillus sp. Soil750]
MSTYVQVGLYGRLFWFMGLFSPCFYGKIELVKLKSYTAGVIQMTGVIAGLVVCMFVFVIRETLMRAGDEDLENY